MRESILARLREFRQLKKSIRGSDEHLIVGIDVAKAKHHAFFGTAPGKSLLRRLIFENSGEGFEILAAACLYDHGPRGFDEGGFWGGTDCRLPQAIG